MNQPHLAHRLARPAVLSLARREAALKDAARRLRRWPREGARPSLTAAPRLAVGCSGRDGKTALQPNRKTAMAVGDWRTTHALQKADMFTRHRHDPCQAVSPVACWRWRSTANSLPQIAGTVSKSDSRSAA